MFDPNKPYTARNGDKVTVLRVLRDGDLLVINEKNEGLYYCDSNGRYDSRKEYSRDLINIPEEINVWISVHDIPSLSHPAIYVWNTEADMKLCKGRDCIATKHIKVTIGEGL